ncbi:hypothetical protein AVENLUH7437_01340 [Acinetobacter venetianus]|nr:hypothetical protein AVENLUH7437_01340 [Acinetobacter venetianus]
MTATALLLDPSSLEQMNAAIDYPRPDRLVKGNPQRLTHSLYEHPNMSCGIWQCEVGAWNIVFADNKQEFFKSSKELFACMILRTSLLLKY